ncbi:hypothetical protein C4K39_0764 [Pseudomonas sessilinigenes]|nr:hypothetical protein C4K39_0764 [Pseudomonas sessilinigenes]
MKIPGADFHHRGFCIVLHDKACLFTKISFIWFEIHCLK